MPLQLAGSTMRSVSRPRSSVLCAVCSAAAARALPGVFLLAVALLAPALAAAQPARVIRRTPEEIDAASPFEIDPVTDVTLISSALAVSVFSELSIQSGELDPQAPNDTSTLSPLDQWLIEREDRSEGSRVASDVVVWSAMGYGIAGALMTGLDEDWGEALVDLTLFAETAAFNWAIANLTKLAVRRPRPLAYLEAEGAQVELDTNSALSFYSLHTSFTAGSMATATYIAFARDPEGWAPWVTLGGGIVMTGLVGYFRVDAMSHFPTDVLAGGVVGACIGVLVPHLHRSDTERGSDPGVRVGLLTGGRGETAGLQLMGLF